MRVLAPLLLALTLVQGCVSPGPAAFRDPGFRPSQIRRPAIALRVSLNRTGAFGEGEFSAQERAALPEAYEAALLEGLNAEGILPVDISLTANRSSRGSQAPLEGFDQAQARSRGEAVNADYVVIVDVRLGRRELVHCEAGRPFRALTTVAAAGLELVRLRDGARLLVEPPGNELQATDLVADCERRRATRQTSQELMEESVGKVLRRLLKP